LVDSLCI